MSTNDSIDEVKICAEYTMPFHIPSYPLKIVILFEGDDSLMMLWRESMLENMSRINTCNDGHSNDDDDNI